MLDTDDFINRLVHEGYSHFCVVPCSFSKSLINALINSSDKIEYLPCASEAVACSVASGLKIAGKKPVVVVQSSGLTNMGSCITSLLVPYDVKFPIIVSWRTYKEGDSEIQHQHLATRLPNLVDAYGYTYTTIDKYDAEIAVNQLLECESNKNICLLEKNTFTAVELNKEHQLDLSQYPKRSEYLKVLNKEFNDENSVFIGTTGNTSREMYSFMPDTNNFYMVGNMGGSLSVGLGMAKAGIKVIVCGGDAEFVMHMGGLTTAGRYTDIDLTYIVFDNESNKSTGGQKTYQEHLKYSAIIEASGISNNRSAHSIDEFELCIKNQIYSPGIKSIYVKCSYDSAAGRPDKSIILRNTQSIRGLSSNEQ
jgi:thiamine pyrophosphate-dependent acetolactate synthase large subunit-like protein